MPEIKRLLVANRGEIARRIMRTARAMGIETVAVYSDADAGAPHVRDADMAVRLGPAPARESYLAIPRILEAAQETGADAIHPGYGFLAENADFADAVTTAGLVFVGPDAEVIRLMADKRAAKQRMAAAGVPTVPGWEGDATDVKTLAKAARDLGLPVMIKAVAGGGGRGMRRVESDDALEDALRAAASEAEAAFGNGRLILEKAIDGARHIEVQVFGARGDVVHMGERDCSAQRRHQKIIEEAPAPALDASVRDRILAAAVAAARAVSYTGAGTVEFLAAPDGGFYFLEMNTRLQVEHGVTEAITGLDLVEWQLRIARGEPLPLRQDAIHFAGHAIEMRLCAEDPGADYVPSSGTVHGWTPPAGDGIRCDHALEDGYEIGSDYDSMVAKLIAHGGDREQARTRLAQALRETALLGVASNKSLLARLLDDPAFADGRVTTDYLESDQGRALAAGPDVATEAMAIAAALWFEHTAPAPMDCWRSSGASAWLMKLQCDGAEPVLATLFATEPGRYVTALGGGEWAIDIRDRIDVTVNGAPTPVHAAFGDDLWLDTGSGAYRIADVTYAPARPAGGADDGRLLAPMAGRVIEVRAGPGDRVQAGAPILTMEAMKIEHRIEATVDGTVVSVAVGAGDQVAARQLLAELAPDASGESHGEH